MKGRCGLGIRRYTRDYIKVLDRRELEARTCECYAVVKRSTTACCRVTQPLRYDARSAAAFANALMLDTGPRRSRCT